MEIDTDDNTSAPSPQTQPPPTTTTQTPAERIADLNAIDLSISTLLTSAATATKILSNQPSSASTLAGAKDQFTQAAHLYFSTLSSIEVRLRRQIYALEEAGLIAAGDEGDARRGRTLTADEGALMRRNAGVGGQLDPSWLNARVSDGVEMGKKREVLERGLELVQRINMKKDRDDDDVIMDG